MFNLGKWKWVPQKLTQKKRVFLIFVFKSFFGMILDSPLKINKTDFEKVYLLNSKNKHNLLFHCFIIKKLNRIHGLTEIEKLQFLQKQMYIPFSCSCLLQKWWLWGSHHGHSMCNRGYTSAPKHWTESDQDYCIHGQDVPLANAMPL